MTKSGTFFTLDFLLDSHIFFIFILFISLCYVLLGAISSQLAEFDLLRLYNYRLRSMNVILLVLFV